MQISTTLRSGLTALMLLLLAACGDPVVLDNIKGGIPANDHGRGLVYDGLIAGENGTLCEGMFAVQAQGRNPLCTHGPDPAPDGVDIANPPPLSAMKSELSVLATAGVPCIGDGASGNRVQAVYAVASDKRDRYSEVKPLIEGWAAHVSQVFMDSARQVGGEREVQWVMDPSCNLDVEHVVLSRTGDDNLSNTISELMDQGYNDPSRKYLIWMDARVYCGIAQIYGDDRPGQENYNNGRFTMFARVDEGCWNSSNSTAAHELVHNLGGVQRSAPHASAQFHCTDEYDRLCYRDGSDVVMTYDCTSTNEGMLDCNHDDYYHPNPPNNSYLDTHWNVADSSFLFVGSAGDPPPPTNAPPSVDAGPNRSTEMPNAAVLSGLVSDDGLPSGSVTSSWIKVSGPGTVTFADASSPSTTATFSAAGSYVLRLTGDDGDLSASDEMTVTATDPAPDPNNPAAYGLGKWRRIGGDAGCGLAVGYGIG